MRDDRILKIDEKEYGVVEASVWARENLVKEDLFEPRGTLQPMQLKYLDIQSMFNNSGWGRDFIKALTECPNMDFFTSPMIQIIIDHQWNYWFKRSVLLLGLPVILQLVVFVYWSNIVITNVNYSPGAERGSFEVQNDVCTFLIICLSCYLLLTEVPLLINQKLKWFTHLHSMVNVISDVLLIENSLR